MNINFDTTVVADCEKPLIDEISGFLNIALYDINDFTGLDGSYICDTVDSLGTCVVGATVRFVHEQLGYMIFLDHGMEILKQSIVYPDTVVVKLTDGIVKREDSDVLNALIKGSEELGFSGSAVIDGRSYIFKREVGLMRAIGVIITSDIDAFNKINNRKNVLN